MKLRFQSLLVIAVWFCLATVSMADTVTMRNGVQLEGDIGIITEIGELAQDFGSGGGSIVIVDDGLRRVFVPQKQTANITQEIISENVLRVDQPASSSVDIIKGVGEPLYVGPFNEFGRRVIVLPSPDGRREFIQGITKISPTYCVLETLTTKKFNTRWESRIATSRVSREVLSAVIQRTIDPANPNERLQVVQLLIEAERYKDAVVELELFLEDFPDLTEKKNLADSLRQAYARQIIREIERRNDSGQYQQAYNMIRQFPTAGIAGEILGRVLELKQDHELKLSQIDEINASLQRLTEQTLQGDALEAPQKEVLQRVVAEISAELNFNNLGRLAGYYRFRDDGDHTIDQKLAFAITGWLMGEADSAGNLQVALSLVEVRDIVVAYLKTKPLHEREALLDRFDAQEGANIANIAKIVAHLKPPVAEGGEAKPMNIPGCFEVVQEDDSRAYRYLVQLPPDYDPYRRYPCIVTLNDTRSLEQQLSWWAGSYSESLGQRVGQAGRHGYIVIAPQWMREGQLNYEYSPMEHARVLDSIRDAMRRFSIDTERMFISGHSDGGDAAWDIALSHPDLWAGYLGVGASAGKYVNHYHPNAIGTFGLYFVHGGFDHPRMSTNKMDWNRYLRTADCDVMVVSYQGRGHEHFQEEIIRMFDWMNLHTKVVAPKKLTVRMMRPWDRFFYWVEVDQFPESTMVLPAAYPQKGKSAAFIEAEIRSERNTIAISKCSARRATVWLNPDVLDLERPVEVIMRGDSFKGVVQTDRQVLLEDVRMRGDRLHPYWAKVEMGK